MPLFAVTACSDSLAMHRRTSSSGRSCSIGDDTDMRSSSDRDPVEHIVAAASKGRLQWVDRGEGGFGRKNLQVVSQRKLVTSQQIAATSQYKAVRQQSMISSTMVFAFVLLLHLPMVRVEEQESDQHLPKAVFILPEQDETMLSETGSFHLSYMMYRWTSGKVRVRVNETLVADTEEGHMEQSETAGIEM